MYLAQTKPDDYGACTYVIFKVKKDIKKWEQESYSTQKISEKEVEILERFGIAYIFDA